MDRRTLLTIGDMGLVGSGPSRCAARSRSLARPPLWPVPVHADGIGPSAPPWGCVPTACQDSCWWSTGLTKPW